MKEIILSVTNPEILNYLEIYKKFYNLETSEDAQIIEEILLNHISQQKSILDGYDSFLQPSINNIHIGHDTNCSSNIRFKLKDNVDELHINK